MIELYTAINTHLSADAGLDTLATGGVFAGFAPKTAEHPLAVFAHLGGPGALHTLTRKVWDEAIVMCKGVAIDGESFAGWDRAAEISQRCEALLTDREADMPLVNGLKLFSVRVQGFINYPEQLENGLTAYHVGRTYRVQYGPS